MTARSLTRGCERRAGARLARPAPRSLRITGTIAEWEQWTAMRFPDDGQYTFPAGSRR